MKIDSKTLNQMQSDMTAIIDHYKINVSTLSETDVYHIWFKTFCSRTYNTANPNVAIKENGERVLSFIDRDNYNLYPCGTNDTTIMTAMRQILKNIKK